MGYGLWAFSGVARQAILFYAGSAGEARSADYNIIVGVSRHILKRIAHGARRIAAAQMSHKAAHN